MMLPTIPAALERHARERGTAPALVDFPHQTVTFAELHRDVVAFSAWLASAGLGRADRVGLVVPSGAAGARLVLGLAANTQLVPLNPALTPQEMLGALNENGLSGVVLPDWIDIAAQGALETCELDVFAATRAPGGAVELRLRVHAARRPAALVSPARPEDVALVLRSSGTTGAPKRIPVTHGNLAAMAARLASPEWFALSASDRVPCTLPLHYAAGLKTSLLVPLLLGASVAFPPEGKALQLAEWIGVLRPTFLSVAPGSLRGMLERMATGPRVGRHTLRFVMCASAYLPDDVRRAAESAFGVPVLEYYALSEAGIMAANPVPPGRLKPGTVGVPAPGELILADASGRPVPAGEVGEILIRGPTVTPGSKGGVEVTPDGWLPTGDLGRLDEDGYLTIAGRVKEVINRGGEKVFPYEVEKALLEHPGVLEAAAFAVPHPRLGESVAAAVVRRAPALAGEDELKSFLATRLAPFKLPRRVHFLDALPRGPTGKVSRRALSEAHASSASAPVPPYDLLEHELLGIWRRLLNRADIGIDDDFYEKGGDSLLAVEMLLELEHFVRRPYPDSALSTFTIRRVAEVVTSGLAGAPEAVTQARGGRGLAILFCHGDYLTRGVYASRLASLLPDGHPVYLLHGGTGSPGGSIEETAVRYLEPALRIAQRGPVVVGGYCNGGLAAWHLAHLLRERGADVAELFLVETLSLNARPELRRLPGVLRAAGSLLPGRTGRFLRERAMPGVWTRARGFASFASLLYGAAARRISSALGQHTAGAGRGISRTADREMLRVMAQYVPPSLDVDVTCFIAREGRHFDTDPAFWRGIARSVRQIDIPGSHLTAVVSERRALAAALGRALKRAAARRNALQVGSEADAAGYLGRQQATK